MNKLLTILFPENMSRKDRYYLAYYLVMFGVMLVATSPRASLSLMIRYVFFGAVIVPLLANPRFVPFAIVSFFGTSANAFYSVLPESMEFCVLCVAVLAAVNSRYLNFDYGGSRFLVVLFVYSVLVSFFYNDLNDRFVTAGLIAFLLLPFVRDEDDVRLLAVAFCLVSFALTALFFVNFRFFAVVVDENQGFESGTWRNPNSLAGLIGLGIPVSMALLTGLKRGVRNWLLSCFLVVVFVSGMFALVLISSRGALVSASLSSLMLVFLSKMRTRYKFCFVLVLVALAVYIYISGYADFMIHRVEKQSSNESFGGRIAIWQRKLALFQNEDFVVQLFGMGNKRCSQLGYKWAYSTHNDFVTAYIGFGFVGLVLFLLAMVSPVVRMRGRDKFVVLALILYMICECFVLEPLYRGYSLFWVYYVLIVRLAVCWHENYLQQ